MAFFDNLGKKVGGVANNISDKTKSFADTSNMKIKISNIDSKMNEQFADLGRAYYAAHKDDVAAECGQIIEGIKQLEAEKEAAQAEINRIKGIVPCPNCGAEVGPGMLFCSACGTRVERPEPEKPKAAPAAFCTNCGSPVAEGMAFCTNCGTRVAPVEPAAPVTPAAPVYEEPAAPVYEAPAQEFSYAPVEPEAPAAPVYEEVITPVYEEPAAPVVEEASAQEFSYAPVEPEAPAAPVYEEVITPVYEEPAAPVVEEALAGGFCPNCGKPVEAGISVCPHCWMQI